jgi:hypothetical protein
VVFLLMAQEGRAMRTAMKAPARGWRVAVVAAVVALVVGAGGLALASIPGPGGVFYGCYSKTNGGLRLIDPSKGQKCTSGEGGGVV